MISKPKVTAAILLSVLMGVVVTPAFAGRYRPTPAGPNRWEYVREEPVEEVQIEEVAIEQPKEKGLFKATWDAIAGTAGAIGRTFGAVYASVFPVKETEAEPEEAKPVEPQTRRHRFAPRFHGMVARRIPYRGR